VTDTYCGLRKLPKLRGARPLLFVFLAHLLSRIILLNMLSVFSSIGFAGIIFSRDCGVSPIDASETRSDRSQSCAIFKTRVWLRAGHFLAVLVQHGDGLHESFIVDLSLAVTQRAKVSQCNASPCASPAVREPRSMSSGSSRLHSLARISAQVAGHLWKVCR